VASTLWLIFEKSLFGIHLRASVDDSAMAGALGVRTGVVYSVTFGLATGLAALGGVVGAQLMPIEPYYALRYLVTLVVIVAVGGGGSIPGTLAACLLLGTIETMVRYFAPEYGELFFYVAVIAIILVLPRGFFGRVA
jgi:branched-chain amino acid transport system permease protein